MASFRVSQGQSAPMGATPADEGVNFSVFSEYAEKVELCLFDESGQNETQRIALYQGDAYCWHAFVHGLEVGARYGFRAYGKYEPSLGFRFNANKVLIDPYARALDREFKWDKTLFSYTDKNEFHEWGFSQKDNTGFIPKSVVVARKSLADIEHIQKRKPRVPWSDTVLYETHVKGFTKLKLDMPEEMRGTFAGLAHDSSVAYLKELGVTTVELLPIHQFIDEEFLTELELKNYWGYNTLSFFAPHSAYLSSGRIDEIYDCIERLHAEGLEVILDVVYNHTAESNHFGPHLSFRGLDNLNYYRLDTNAPQSYINDTGCGNTLRAEHPKVMQLVLDSLRFWAGEMGVDGFRFDLASILGRDQHGFDSRSAFFQAISQDPLLSTCKLIAEPWDIGPGGYQLGAYPEEWSEWNDQYRDVCRRYWRGDGGMLPEFARRIHGSSDIFEHTGRSPRSSVNFICSHDGFTLSDLVSYKERNNFANKENNRDGHSENLSDNYGAEGPCHDKNILNTRARQQRNFLATLFLSQGTPMLLSGDELGRSQAGNNNAYCQDNELNWLQWASLSEKDKSLLDFTKHLIKIRKQFPILRSQDYIHFPDRYDIEHMCSRWIRADGQPMDTTDWHEADNRVLGWILESENDSGHELLLFLFNSSTEDVQFALPDEPDFDTWSLLMDTALDSLKKDEEQFRRAASLILVSRSMKLLTARKNNTLADGVE